MFPLAELEQVDNESEYERDENRGRRRRKLNRFVDTIAPQRAPASIRIHRHSYGAIILQHERDAGSRL